MKKILSLILCLICVFGCSVNAYSDIEIKGNPSDWNPDRAVFGQWSFYVTNQFYKAESYSDKETYNYFSEEELKKTPAVFANVYSPIKWIGMNETLLRSGLVIASNKGNNADHNWRCALEVYPGSVDKNVHFVTMPTVKNVASPVGVTSCFTVPEDGIWRIKTDIKNYGWIVNGLVDYGKENMARVSIIKGEENKETPESTFEFEILRKTQEDPGFDSGFISLNRGDRIYLGVYNGNDGNMDDFFGNHTISLCDENGAVLKEYSLGDVSFTSTGKWNFFKSAPGNTNMYLYTPMYAVRPEWMSSDFGVTGGYAAVPISDWKDKKVQMPKNGSVSWNLGEEFFKVKTADEDVIIARDVEEDGEYLLRLTARNTGMYQISDGAALTVSSVGSEDVSDSNIIGNLIIPESSDETVAFAKLEQLSGGDRILVRVNKNNSATADELEIDISLNKAKEGLRARYTSGGKEISSIDEINPEGSLNAELKFINYSNNVQDIAVLAALYDENNVITKVIANPVESVEPFEEKTFGMDITLEGKPSKIVFFAWDGYMNPGALAEMKILE